MFQQFSLSARSPFFFLLLLRPKGLARAHESLNSVRFLLEATCVYHKIDVSIEREREREKGTAAKGKETKEKKKKKKKKKKRDQLCTVHVSHGSLSFLLSLFLSPLSTI